jgi:TonB family protein
MRKAGLVARDKHPGLVCLLLTVVSITASAQDQIALPMPKNPNELLLLVQKQNRLTNADISPWHLKISVKQLDASGGVMATSQMEEFWAGPSKYKLIYTNPTGSMSEYATEKGLFRSAGTPTPPGPLMQAGNAFTNPIFESESVIEKWILKRENRKEEDGAKLVCLSTEGIRVGAERHDFTGSTYCLDAAQPSLVSRLNPVSSGGEAVYTRSDIQNFHGFFVPREVNLTVGGKRTLEAHLDVLEDLTQAEDALFVPPPDAVPAPVVKMIAVSSGVAQAMREQGAAPVYPPAAEAAGISGTVVLEARIGKDGSVSDLRVVQGPQELQQAAIDAVRTWKYKAYLLNGEAVEVRTQVNVVFRLH